MINNNDNNPAAEESFINIGNLQLAGKLIVSLIASSPYEMKWNTGQTQQ